MNAFSMDLKGRGVAACDRGEGTRDQTARRFCASVPWVYTLLRRRHAPGSIAPKPPGGGQWPAFDEAASQRLRQAVAATIYSARDAVTSADVAPVTSTTTRHGLRPKLARCHASTLAIGVPRQSRRGRPKGSWSSRAGSTPRVW